MAWDFDQAVSLFGNYVEDMLKQTDDKGRQKYSLKFLLGIRDSFRIEDFEGAPGIRIHTG